MSSTIPKERRVKAGTYDFKEPQVKPPSFSKLIKRILNLSANEFCKINWYYPGGREAFPGEPRMWMVDRCYPYLKEGQTLVDIVILDHKRKEAKRKHKYFQSKGINYIALDRGAEIIIFDGEE